MSDFMCVDCGKTKSVDVMGQCAIGWICVECLVKARDYYSLRAKRREALDLIADERLAAR